MPEVGPITILLGPGTGANQVHLSNISASKVFLVDFLVFGLFFSSQLATHAPSEVDECMFLSPEGLY
jgi:hypothetical protein